MNVSDILSRLPQLQALVVGDICLDRWCHYDPDLSDPSRETGLPRLAVVRTENTAGAGGTIANNLRALGVNVAVLGCYGDDGFGHDLLRALKDRAIEPDLLVCARGYSTFVYTKLISAKSGQEDQSRVDHINSVTLPPKVEAELIARFEAEAPRFDVILVSDQAETAQTGTITPNIRLAIESFARQFPDKVVWVDSRVRAEHFRRVILKPNRQEAEAACLRAFGTIDFARLLRERELRLLVITSGADGADIYSQSGHRHIPGRLVQPIDICGAGDSFSAGASCALALTGDAETAISFGNLVASVTVTKKGTGTASPAELMAVCL